MASSCSHDQLKVDMRLWKICSEPLSFNPVVNSCVLYFPEGHGQHSCFQDAWTDLMTYGNTSCYLCAITSIDYLADAQTEELFLRLILSPIKDDNFQEDMSKEDGIGVEGLFVKTLSNTDTNNELRLPVNACDVFPDHGDGSANSTQKVSVTDFHGVSWDFTHIHQSKDNRYVLSAGWKKFLKEKNLVVGDSLVFVKSLDEKNFVGIRRKVKVAAVAAAKETKSKSIDEVGVDAYNVMEVLKHIEYGEPFEIVFHPNYCDFLVDPKNYEESKQVLWRPGMRISFEDKDGTSQTGSITEVRSKPYEIRWRMLRIKWDDPEAVDRVAVSPWEVQIIPNEDI